VISTLLLAFGALAAHDGRQPWGPAAVSSPENPPNPEAAASAEVGATEPITEDRIPPDYDGVANHAPPGQAMVWVPRVVLAPVWAVDRFVLYPPSRAFSVWSEKIHLQRRLVDFFTFFDGKYRLRVFPTALVDMGYYTSVGVYGQLLGKVPPYSITSVHAVYGGKGWSALKVRESIALTADGRDGTSAMAGSEVSGTFLIKNRPDLVFYGLGPDPGRLRTRYDDDFKSGNLLVDLHMPLKLELDVGGSADRHAFGPGHALIRNDPSIQTVFDVGEIPGWPGYDIYHADAGLAFDSRPPRPDNGTGVRLQVNGAGGSYTELDGIKGTILRTRGEADLFLDLTGRNNVIGLSQYGCAVQGLDNAEIPFPELCSLGGSERLRGFLDGRYRGFSALSSRLDYTWPVWGFADATIFSELGGVFDHDFDGASFKEMSASFGTGIETTKKRDNFLQALVAVGTSPLDTPFAIDSVRFVVGTNRGF
jgi:hypothetical protein